MHNIALYDMASHLQLRLDWLNWCAFFWVETASFRRAWWTELTERTERTELTERTERTELTEPN
jgi:hypothetical protein